MTIRTSALVVLTFLPHTGFTKDEVGSETCAPCHASIYKTYMDTGMARSSGRTGSGVFRESFQTASFQDTGTGARYRIALEQNSYRMEFARPAARVQGTRTLDWFIGSGNVGRSYLTSVNGFLFQAPVSYYSSAERWNLSPGFAGQPEIHLSRPVEPACLNCHASGVQWIPGTQNRYKNPAILEGGVSCERCHGPGRRHVQAMRSGKTTAATEIVNPAKLAPAPRDSICLQCHLTGVARVARPGRDVTSFRPGDLLSDYMTIFVSSTSGGSERAATDHAEQLARSACQQASGARMWCGSCHDAHSKPTPDRRVAFYRQACLNCHETQARCSADLSARAATDDDCASCHMPKGKSREGEHVVYTDHTISRPNGRQSIQAGGEFEFRSFWNVRPPERDVALAYASLAMEEPRFRPTALALLEKAELQGSADATLLAQLAQFYDRLGHQPRAIELYERTLRLDPHHPAAAANLAVYRMQQGRSSEAMELWRDVFSRNPSLVGPGINVALEQMRSGNVDAAQSSVLQVLRYHPDLEMARKLLERIRSATPAAARP